MNRSKTQHNSIKALAVLALAVLACSGWDPFGGAIYARLPTPTPGGAAAAPTPAYTVTASPTVCTVQAEALNLRKGAGTAYKVIDWLAAGQELTVTDQAGGWLKVTTPDGSTGWVNSAYCKGH